MNVIQLLDSNIKITCLDSIIQSDFCVDIIDSSFKNCIFEMPFLKMTIKNSTFINCRFNGSFDRSDFKSSKFNECQLSFIEMCNFSNGILFKNCTIQLFGDNKLSENSKLEGCKICSFYE